MNSVYKYTFRFELNGKVEKYDLYAHSIDKAKEIVTLHNELLSSNTLLLQRAHCYKVPKKLQIKDIELQQIKEIRRRFYEKN